MSGSLGVGTESPPRAAVLGFSFDIVSLEAAVERLVAAVANPGPAPLLVVTLNPERLIQARREPEYGRIVRGASLVTVDGIGLVRALRRRGVEATRVTGADIVDAYAARAALLGHRLALAGGGPGVARAAAAALQARHPALQVVATDDGRPDAAMAERLAAARPQVVLAAFGAGSEERFLDRHLGATGAAAGVTVGGTFDFLAGRVQRAPRPVQRAGLEWLWRLVFQPWRLRRQLALPLFWWLERREAARPR
ncbi:MAG: WecB/TagA/CpsF family glycosyltransferase [Candidatus Dormibacteria bacterium]